MIYRKLGKTKLDVSIIGVGTGGSFPQFDYPTVKRLFDCAVDNGVNLIDIFNASEQFRSTISKVIAGRRDKFIIQGHMGTMDDNGQIVRTREINVVKENFERMYSELNTDYIDIGTFFYIDTDRDYDEIFNSEIIDYAVKLKEQGRISYIAISSHNPRTSLKAINTGLLDTLMFSINPAYDMERADTLYEELSTFSDLKSDDWQVEAARQELYLTCEQLGIGITVMKALGGGSLIDAEASPFGRALTVTQCCHYALSRPAVASIVLGFEDREQLLGALDYLQASEDEKKFSHIFSNQSKLSMAGRCVYCTHCQPCPSSIDVALVTKFLDLAQIKGKITDTIRDHYFNLESNASDCIMCGECEKNCPFGVDIRKNMERALDMFHDTPATNKV